MLRRMPVTLEPPPIPRPRALPPIRRPLRRWRLRPSRRRRWRGPGSSSWCWISGPVRSASNSATPIIWRCRSRLVVAFAAARGAPRQVRAGRVCGASARSARQCLARRLSRRRRMEVLAGPDRLLRPGRRSRQRRHAAAAARHRKSDPLRRGAVALPRPLARRLQRADLAADGGDGRVGHRVGEAGA